jgi:hypothetical protein
MILVKGYEVESGAIRHLDSGLPEGRRRQQMGCVPNTKVYQSLYEIGQSVSLSSSPREAVESGGSGNTAAGRIDGERGYRAVPSTLFGAEQVVAIYVLSRCYSCARPLPEQEAGISTRDVT